MGRKKLFSPDKYVDLCADKSSAKCIQCDRILKTHMGNIKRHYIQVHKINIDEMPEDNIPSSSKKKKVTERVFANE